MNKFRAILHPAFFDDLETGSKNVESTEIPGLKDLEKLKLSISGEFKESTNEFCEALKRGREKQTEKDPNYDSHSTRFFDRMKAKKDKKEYAQFWNQNITQGFGALISALEDKKYFEQEGSKTKEEVKTEYWNAVKKQYVENVWFAENEQFDAQKNFLFGPGASVYPANTVFCELTGESTIFSNRNYTEGYKTDILNQKSEETASEEAPESMSDRQNRNFLADDLTKYLWDIRKTPGILNVMKWVPIFSVKVDRPSQVDRKAIKNFLKASNKLDVAAGKDPAIAFLEALQDNRLNGATPQQFEQILNTHGITIKKQKYLDDVVEAGKFYIATQSANNGIKDQHAIYLSVLKIIEDEGGVQNAVNKYQSMVEQAAKDKKTEKKEGYKSGEKLGATNPELYEIAQNLGITDFASATRLSEKDDNYFKDTPVEKILANLNNDNIIDARDTFAGGSKTGSQFLEIFNQVGKEKALSNLVERAKLLNKTLGVGLPDALLNAKTIEADVKGGHTGLILLLQNIINKPGEDLYTLLSGHSENPFEGVDLSNLDEKADKAAEAMLAKMKPEELKKLGLTLPTSESMQSGLAAALTTEYKRGIGLGSKISFDEWIKGVDMNTGFQLRDGKVLVVGIGLSYHNKFNLGKGWSTTPELSASGFIPIGMGKPDLSGSVGFNNETAKERITENGIQEHLGVQGGVTLMPAGVVVLSAGFKWEQDKLAGIESAEQKKLVEFRDQIMSPILNDICETCKTIRMPHATKLNFNENALTKIYRDSILKEAKNQKVPEEEQSKVVDAVMRLLLNYNGADLAQEGVRDIIAQGISEQYAMAWAEDRKAHVTKKAYLSGANLGAFWVAGSPLVGIYAGVKFTKHGLDGYGNHYGKEGSIDNFKENANGVRDEKSLSALNTRLGLVEGQGLKILEGGKGIQIPKSILGRVKVNKSMKKLLVKDKDGNVIVSPWTTMGESIIAGAATQSRELLIGEGESGFIPLNVVNDDWFEANIQDVNKAILSKENVEHFYTKDGILKGINQLKAENPDNEVLKNFNPTDQQINTLITQLNNLKNKDKIAKIIIERQSGGTFRMNAQEGDREGKGLDIEYKAKLEMFDSKAKKLADRVYERAASLKDPTALNKVKHPQSHPDYESFVENLMGLNGKSKDLNKAKAAIIKIINNLNTQYPNNKLTIEDGNWPSDPKALEQALLSINNVFARSARVKGAGTETVSDVQYNRYEFTTNMGDIIEQREKEIGGTLQTRIKNGTKEIKESYANLMKAMGNHRKNNENEFNTKSARAVHLDNAVGFNLGDKYNPENPLLNPEIYDKQVDLGNSLKVEDRDRLHRRAIENFINQPALFKSIKDALGVGDDVVVKIKDKSEFTQNGDGKQTIELDIGGKIVKLSSDMKFGYFTQCVNHTVILENIQLTDDKGKVVQFTSGTWREGRYVEGNKSSIVATTTVGIAGSVIVHDGRKKGEESFTKPTEEDRGKIDKTGPEDAIEVTDPNAKDGDEGGDNIDLGW